MPLTHTQRCDAQNTSERASACGLTECQGRPMCTRCRRYREIDAGWPASADERRLRRLLAVRVAMPHTYFDGGEAQGQEHGITIDFMRETVADIDAKLRALNVARAECAALPAQPMTACPHGVPHRWACEDCETPNNSLSSAR